MNIFIILAGLLFSIFLPGYLISLLLFRKLDILARITLSLAFTTVIVTVLSILLSWLSTIAGQKTITSYIVWSSLLLISLIFVTLIFIKYRKGGFL